MVEPTTPFTERLKARLQDRAVSVREALGETTVEIPADRWAEAATFLRDDQRPTASVMVNLRPGRILDQNQVAGIVHLVSSSVPRMSAEGVKIVNQEGSLLTVQADPLMRAGLNANQLEYVRAMEKAFIERIENILVPMVGKDNFRAQVAADVDFNQVEQTAETYKPNPTPDQAIRSQQTNEVINPLPGAQGRLAACCGPAACPSRAWRRWRGDQRRWRGSRPHSASSSAVGGWRMVIPPCSQLDEKVSGRASICWIALWPTTAQ